MTRYEKGYLTKMAQLGIGQNALGTGIGALGGAAVGALASRKNRLRNALIGLALGGGAGYGASAFMNLNRGLNSTRSDLAAARDEADVYKRKFTTLDSRVGDEQRKKRKGDPKVISEWWRVHRDKPAKHSRRTHRGSGNATFIS